MFVAGWLRTLTAFSFQTSTMLVGSAAAPAEGTGIDPVTATATMAEAVASHRRAERPVVEVVMSILLRNHPTRRTPWFLAFPRFE